MRTPTGTCSGVYPLPASLVVMTFLLVGFGGFTFSVSQKKELRYMKRGVEGEGEREREREREREGEREREREEIGDGE